MTNEMTRDNSRWNEPAPFVRRRNGRLIYPRGEARDEVRRLARVTRAWQYYNETGDRRELVRLGILPTLDAD